MTDLATTDLATYSRSGPVGTIVMEDGKANVMSLAMLNALHAAFDQAEKDKTVVILKARGKHFSGGFDLNVFAKGSAEDQYLMLKAGAELALASCRSRRPSWRPARATPTRWAPFSSCPATIALPPRVITGSA
jgi:enoyl-CoA hydratase/carnithine racemase